MEQIRKKYRCRGKKISNAIKEMGIKANNSKVNRLLIHDYFENIDTEEKAYILGLLISDGSVAEDSIRTPMIRIELIDRDVLELIRKETNTGAEIKTNAREGRNETYIWGVRSQKMAEDLAKYGVVPNKTKKIDVVYDRIPQELMRHYLRGLIDGDGSIYMSGGRWYVSFTGGNRDFVDSVQTLAKELIGKKNRLSITEYMGVCKFTFASKDTRMFCYKLYKDSNIYIERKKILAEKAYKNIIS